MESSISDSDTNIIGSESRPRYARQAEEASPGISSTKYRAGAPPVRPLPLIDGCEWDALFSNENAQKATKLALQILTSHGITRPDDPINEVDPPSFEVEDSAFAAAEEQDDDHIMVSMRSIDGEESTKRLTLLITADWDDSTSPSTWPIVVEEIKKACDETFTERLDVEMIATQLSRRKYLEPFSGGSELKTKWNDTILPNIVDSLAKLAKDSILFVGLCRLGFNVDLAVNPITVYIATDYDCPETKWPALIRSVRSVRGLDQFPEPVEICVEHNALSTLAFDLLPPKVPDESYDVN